ncbi:hypothetical protein, partial [Xanthomonas vasicola]|uniref:hypothetical protein n=1 Tax=Xanthomonas vasicola TaxID=56459 RepID=UPI0012FD3086
MACGATHRRGRTTLENQILDKLLRRTAAPVARRALCLATAAAVLMLAACQGKDTAAEASKTEH